MNLGRTKGSEGMEGFFRFQWRLIKGVFLLNLIIAAIGYFIFEPWIPFLTGLFFGTLISILNFRLLYITLNSAVKMDPSRAQVFTSSRYMIRFLLTAIVLVVSLKAEYINILGTVIGLISFKIAIFKVEVFNHSKLYKNTMTRKEEK